jgi:hypothetical protein
MEVALETLKYLHPQRRVVFPLCINSGQAIEKRCAEVYLVTKQTYKRRRNGGNKFHRK